MLRDQEDAVRADPKLRVPLVLRANAGEDCVDVLLRSELSDIPGEALSKVSAHIHFVQFDVQASDGVDTGFNYEQTIRPFHLAGETLVSPAAVGDTAVKLGRGDRFQPGELVGIGMDQGNTFEIRRIAHVDGGKLTLDAPLAEPHRSGEIVSTEFVRYRWYPDTQFGTAFFHDHVNVIQSGQHGLYGALIAEPPGSTYHDPKSGDLLESGLLADIRTTSRLSVDVTGGFRELVTLIQDDNPLTHIGRSSGSSLNLRVEPPESRSRDPSQQFSSRTLGDPETPVLEAYLGDPLAFRTLVGASNDVHTWHLDGHWFRRELWSSLSPPISTVHIGISERFDLVVPRAGGPQRRSGDYLFYEGRSFKLREGSWGLLRVHGDQTSDLQPLPGHERITPAPATVCPAGAPAHHVAVSAVEAPLPMLGGARGRIYVTSASKAAVLGGTKAVEPLVLHVTVGDCLVIDLSNDLPSGLVSFHADMLAHDPRNSGGVAAGLDPDQAAAPGATRSFTFYASPEVGETTAMVEDFADVLKNPALGLYGAIIVGPRGARYVDPYSGHFLADGAGADVAVYPPGAQPYRDYSLFLQDEDAAIGTHRMPYGAHVEGVVGLNYAADPLPARLQANPDASLVFSPAAHGLPATPLLEAAAGDPIRFHVLAPWSEQAHVFSIEGHRWPEEPGRSGTPLLSAVTLGGGESATIQPVGGAGGDEHLAGDYVYGDHREPYREAGLWGIFRVHPACASSPLVPLESTSACAPGPQRTVVLLMSLAFVAALGLLVWRRLHTAGGA